MNEIITAILKREGWDKYTNYPNDRGGPTKWGITLKAWSDYIKRPATAEDVKMISETQARNFYFVEYISKPGFDKIANVFLAEFIIDCGVNHGVKRASKWLQSAARVKDDGKVGPVTLQAVNVMPWMSVFLRTAATRVKFYAHIASDQPPADPDLPNLRGWMSRAAAFLEDAAVLEY